jgi:cytochrome c-type biogenesis protein CcmF
MAPDLGLLMLYLVIAVNLIIIISYKFKYSFAIYRILTATSFLLIMQSFLCHIYSFVISDFTVLNVYYNSHTSKPLIYKISGAWGNHEGSMLLWLLAMSFFSLVFMFFTKRHHELVKATIAIQAFVITIFCLYTTIVSNPFERIFPAPLNGLGLNPILQDIGLAFHPPMLYMGYVGFSIAFSGAIAAILTNNISSQWAQIMRPWVMLSWSFLTLGIGLGSWWAYRELGWGGYWFWDPVENASLMPWLSGTALLHSLFITEKKEKLKMLSVLLSIITFALSLIGTFIVRSGLITSVHSFAVDPERGVFILAIIAFVVGMALLLLAVKGINNIQHPKMKLWSLEWFVVLNNLLFLTAAFIVVIGTLYPLYLELVFDEKISIGAAYYNKILTPIVFISLLLMGILNNLEGKQLKFGDFIIKQKWAILLSVFSGVYLVIATNIKSLAALSVIVISVYSIVSIIESLIKRARDKNFYLMCSAHLGFALIILGVSINAGFSDEAQHVFKLNDMKNFHGYNIKLADIGYNTGENYVSRIAVIEATKQGRKNYLYPESRLFLIEKQVTTEAAILHGLFHDLYINIGDTKENKEIEVNMLFQPGIPLLWLGCISLFVTGLIGLVIRVRASVV